MNSIEFSKETSTLYTTIEYALSEYIIVLEYRGDRYTRFVYSAWNNKNLVVYVLLKTVLRFL